jgi:hypothetical protein
MLVVNLSTKLPRCQNEWPDRGVEQATLWGGTTEWSNEEPCGLKDGPM